MHELDLFGSRAKGTFIPDSDVDLAYVLTGSDLGEVLAYSMFEACDWENELRLLLGFHVELHMADPATGNVVWPAVLEHGQLVFRKIGYQPAGT